MRLERRQPGVDSAGTGFPPVLPVWWLAQPRRHLGGSPVDESRIILSPLCKHRTLVVGLPIRVGRAEPPSEGDLTDFFTVLS